MNVTVGSGPSRTGGVNVTVSGVTDPSGTSNDSHNSTGAARTDAIRQGCADVRTQDRGLGHVAAVHRDRPTVRTDGEADAARGARHHRQRHRRYARRQAEVDIDADEMRARCATGSADSAVRARRGVGGRHRFQLPDLDHKTVGINHRRARSGINRTRYRDCQRRHRSDRPTDPPSPHCPISTENSRDQGTIAVLAIFDGQNRLAGRRVASDRGGRLTRSIAKQTLPPPCR